MEKEWGTNPREISTLLLIAWAENRAQVEILREDSNSIEYKVVIKK